MDFTIDPRPDLKEDSYLWTRLLAIAAQEDMELCKVLHGFRCGGTLIQWQSYGYILTAFFDPRTGWDNPEFYKEMREEWLVPNRDIIAKVLKQLEVECWKSQNVE